MLKCCSVCISTIKNMKVDHVVIASDHRDSCMQDNCGRCDQTLYGCSGDAEDCDVIDYNRQSCRWSKVKINPHALFLRILCISVQHKNRMPSVGRGLGSCLQFVIRVPQVKVKHKWYVSHVKTSLTNIFKGVSCPIFVNTPNGFRNF